MALDLDGILAVRDIAYDLFKKHGLGREFKTASTEIADAALAGKDYAGKKAYAGQTLEHVMNAHAPSRKIPVSDLEEIARGAKLVKGAKELVKALKKSPTWATSSSSAQLTSRPRT